MIKKKNKSDYDSGYKWDDLFLKHGESLLNYPADSWVISNLKILGKPNGILLDAGCGSGRHFFEAAKKGWNIIAVDFSSSVLNNIKNKLKKDKLRNYQFVKADLHKLDLGETKVDAGICADVISVVDNPSRVLQKLHEHAKKDSKFLVTFQNYLDDTCGKGDLTEEVKGYSSQYELDGVKYRFYTKQGVESIIDKSIWEIDKIEEYYRKDPAHAHRSHPHTHFFFGAILRAK